MVGWFAHFPDSTSRFVRFLFSWESTREDVWQGTWPNGIYLGIYIYMYIYINGIEKKQGSRPRWKGLFFGLLYPYPEGH